MSLVDDVLQELPGMRLAAESLMLDTGAAKRPSGRGYNSSTQSDGDTYTDLFSSPCKLKAVNVAALTAEAGGRTATTVRLELHLPVGTAPLTVGDVWTMTAVDASSSATVGATYRVTAPVDGSFLTARRYEVERVVS
jgi:hypothetical protein